MVFLTKISAPNSVYETHRFVYSLFPNLSKRCFTYLKLRGGTVLITSTFPPKVRHWDVMEYSPGIYRFFTRVNAVRQLSSKKRVKVPKTELRQWLAEKLAKYDCKLLSCKVVKSGFEFVDKDKGFPVHYYEVLGTMEASDRIEELLVHGIGRERGFGYGSILLLTKLQERHPVRKDSDI